VLITEVELARGTRAFIWPLLSQDRDALRDGYENLSAESRNHRFLASVTHLTETMLDHLVDDVDGVDHVATALLKELVRQRPAGVVRIVTTVSADNAPSLAMLRRLGKTTVTSAGIHARNVVVELTAEALPEEES
jgi:hypothetical protein